MSDWLMTRAARTFVRASYLDPFIRRHLRRVMEGTVTVLLYHRIAEHADVPWLEAAGLPYTPPAVFREHLRMLAELGVEFFTLDDLDSQIAAPAGKRKFPATDRPGVVITFDDGFADNFTIAAPILESFQARGVFFITTSLPDQEILWDHRLAWLLASDEGKRWLMQGVADRLQPAPIPASGPLWAARQLLSPVEIESLLLEVERRVAPLTRNQIIPLYASWDQIAAAARRGHQVGAHTLRHPMRYTLSAAELASELAGSKLIVESHLQQEARAFSYPFNAHLFADEALCRSVGFRQIATVDPGRLSQTAELGHIPRRTVFCIHDSKRRFRELLLEPGFAE